MGERRESVMDWLVLGFTMRMRMGCFSAMVAAIPPVEGIAVRERKEAICALSRSIHHSVHAQVQ